MPAGADTVVMQERATEDAAGVRVAAGAVDEGRARTGASPARTSRPGSVVFARRPAGAPGRARHDRLARHRRGRGLPPAARRLLLDRRRAACRSARRSATGEIYDSNRYTIHGMLTRLGCEVIDMGVVPRRSRRRSSARSPTRPPRPTSSSPRRRVGRRGRFRQAAARQAGRGAVLEDRDEAGPPARLRPASAARTSSACRATRCR